MEITKTGTGSIGDAKVNETSRGKSTAKAGAVKDTHDAGMFESIDKGSPEKVLWSQDASLISEGVQAAKSSPDTRADRVASLKASIAGGKYHVEPKDIAERMIQSSLEDDVLTRKSD